MLGAELRGLPYSKAGHRRRLLPLLLDRSEGAVERKHGNVSAVLIQLGFPYVSGYKPYGNCQRLLHTVVAERLAAAADLRELVAREIAAPPDAPRVRDILAAMVDRPRRTRARDVRETVPAWTADLRTRDTVDYLAAEARNAALGRTGELFVVAFERARLRHAGVDGLADRVEHVAATRGDGDGFDVLSFETDGRERLIEVKTTRYGAMTPFHVTESELRRSEVDRDRYRLYRVHDFRASARMFSAAGALASNFDLAPREYVARLPAG